LTPITKKGSGSAGLRQRKKATTRQALLDAALRLFDEKGFAGTSVDEIAGAADVSRSTFFRYFGSKEAVLFGASDEAGHLFIDLLEARPSEEGPFDAFEGALVQLAQARAPTSGKEASRLLNDLFLRDPTLRLRRVMETDRWASAIAETLAKRAGRTIPSTEDRMATHICLAVAEEVGRAWREIEGDTPVQESVRVGFARARDIVSERRA
jgi:AcrR family transcriptional regulator